MTDLHTLLYLSTLAPGTDESAIGRIARRARVANAEKGISGLLVFDGVSFLQCLEGPHEALAALLLQIKADPRHIDLDLLCWLALTGARRHPRWSLAYHVVDDADDALERFRGHEGDAALIEFDRLVRGLDVGAGLG